MFNIFRILGDLSHVASIVILLLKIFSSKNCRGISLKTQLLYCVIFIARYMDLFWNFASLYNSVMKVIFITTSCLVVYFMKYKSPYKETYDAHNDSFYLPYILGPCFLLALVFNEAFTLFEILWAFSIYLEAVAIIPQIIMVHAYAKQEGSVENLTSHYVFTLGAYRAFYLLNWIYRLMTEDNYSAWIVWIAGAVQTAVYADFFYYYLKARVAGSKMTLPL